MVYYKMDINAPNPQPPTPNPQSQPPYPQPETRQGYTAEADGDASKARATTKRRLLAGSALSLDNECRVWRVVANAAEKVVCSAGVGALGG
jgi:hypothetical protein